MIFSQFKAVACLRPLLALIFAVLLAVGTGNAAFRSEKQSIHALYIPLADHYAARVIYERYRDKMVHADFKIQQM